MKYIFPIVLMLAGTSLLSMESLRARNVENQAYWQQPLALSSTELAEVIFSDDLRLFLAMDPAKIAEKYVFSDHQADAHVDVFLMRIDTVSDLVRSSIREHDFRQAAIRQWIETANILLRQDDLFGYICVTLGLLNGDYIGQLDLDLTRRHIYGQRVTLLGDRAYIPAVFHEGGRFIQALECISMMLPPTATDAEIVAAQGNVIYRFTDHMRHLQNAYDVSRKEAGG